MLENNRGHQHVTKTRERSTHHGTQTSRTRLPSSFNCVRARRRRGPYKTDLIQKFSFLYYIYSCYCFSINYVYCIVASTRSDPMAATTVHGDHSDCMQYTHTHTHTTCTMQECHGFDIRCEISKNNYIFSVFLKKN